MKYLLALDQGTTSSRAIIFDDEGSLVGVAQKEFDQWYPQLGWVEHDPWDLWNTLRSVAEQVMNVVGLQARDLAGIGITNQRETSLVWDRATGEPLWPAIVWQDRRTADLCRRLSARGVDDFVRERTGLVVDPYFSATKIQWILDHVPGARGRAERGELAFGTVDTWILWQLTGGTAHLTDATNASRTLLFDIHAGCWDPDLCDLLRVPPSLLPGVRDTSGLFGEVSGDDTLRGAPILAMAGDQHAALFGQACFSPGTAKNTYGTGCFALMHTGAQPFPSKHRLLSTVAWQMGGRREYALEGSVFVGGAVVQWLRDGLGIISHTAEVEGLAAEVDDNGGLYLVPAFAGLGAPHWDASARGLLVGITRGTGRAHIARAALESIAFQSTEVLETMRADCGLELPELRVDGGAAENDLLMQFQADILQVPVVRPETTETTALGAAYLAGLAAGVWSDPAQLARQWTANRRFEPQRSPAEVAELRHGWARALERAKHWNVE